MYIGVKTKCRAPATINNKPSTALEIVIASSFAGVLQKMGGGISPSRPIVAAFYLLGRKCVAMVFNVIVGSHDVGVLLCEQLPQRQRKVLLESI